VNPVNRILARKRKTLSLASGIVRRDERAFRRGRQTPHPGRIHLKARGDLPPLAAELPHASYIKENNRHDDPNRRFPGKPGPEIFPGSSADRFTGQQPKLTKHAGTFMRRVK
jgi:hypothetical protein